MTNKAIINVGMRVRTSDTENVRNIYRDKLGVIVNIENEIYFENPIYFMLFDDNDLNSSSTHNGAMRITKESLIPELYIIEELTLD